MKKTSTPGKVIFQENLKVLHPNRLASGGRQLAGEVARACRACSGAKRRHRGAMRGWAGWAGRAPGARTGAASGLRPRAGCVYMGRRHPCIKMRASPASAASAATPGPAPPASAAWGCEAVRGRARQCEGDGGAASAGARCAARVTLVTARALAAPPPEPLRPLRRGLYWTRRAARQMSPLRPSRRAASGGERPRPPSINMFISKSAVPCHQPPSPAPPHGTPRLLVSLG